MIGTMVTMTIFICISTLFLMVWLLMMSAKKTKDRLKDSFKAIQGLQKTLQDIEKDNLASRRIFRHD